jgi:hypothetical protein
MNIFYQVGDESGVAEAAATGAADQLPAKATQAPTQVPQTNDGSDTVHFRADGFMSL